MGKRGPHNPLDDVGIEAVCEMVCELMSTREIAQRCGVRQSHLIEWLWSKPDRSARYLDARALSAEGWEERAMEVLLASGGDMVSVTRAREIASHLRWRASHANAKRFGDRQHVEVSGVTLGELLESLPTPPPTAK